MLTSVFVLVASVAFVGAGLSLTLIVSFCSRLQQLFTQIESSRLAKLSAEVGALADALEASRCQTRAEFGRVWQRMPPARSSTPEELAEDGEFDELDPVLAAMLAL